MNDVVVKDRKTGVEKVLPRKVYENLSHKYKLIGEAEEPEQEIVSKKNEGLNPPVDHVEAVKFEPAVQVIDGKVTEIQTSTEPEIEPMTDEYIKLSGGKKPDGRWSPEKLKAKVAELKNTVTVDTDESK